MELKKYAAYPMARFCRHSRDTLSEEFERGEQEKEEENVLKPTAC
jgi:hypothetical protein